MANIIKVALLGDAKSLQDASGKAVKSLGQVESKSSSASKKIAAIGTKLAVGLATVAAAAAGYAVKQGAALQESQDNLRNALKQQGQSINSLGDQYAPLLKLNEKFGNSNADVNESLQQLVRAGVPAKKALTDEAIAANLAAARHISLSSATGILTKVETGHVALLGRLGIQTKDASGKTISQAAAIKLLSTRYKDAAKDAGDTFAGKLKAAKVELSDMAARIGLRLIPILEKLGVDVAGVVEWFEKHRKVAIALGLVVGTIVTALIAYAAAVKAVEIATTLWTVATKIAAAAQWLFNAAMDANPIVLVVAGLAALGAAIYLAYKKFGVFHDAVDMAWQILQSVFHWIQSNWKLLLVILTGPIGAAVAIIATHWKAIVHGAQDVLHWFQTAWGVIDAIVVRPFADAAGQAISKFTAVVRFFEGLAKLFGHALKDVSHALVSPFETAFNDIKRIWDDTVGKLHLPGAIGGIVGKVAGFAGIKLAAGGIVTSPTLALVGESGPEAVIPLHRVQNFANHGSNVTINMPAGIDPTAVVQAQARYNRRNGVT